MAKATGQEKHGIYADPRLVSAGNGGIGRLPIEEYLLKAGSPAKDAGRKVALSKEWLAERRKFLTETGAEAFGIPMEPKPVQEDYWGNKLKRGGTVSIGAHEGE